MCTQFGMGGITRHVVGLTAWLRGRGHEVSFAGTADVWGNPGIEPGFLDLPTKFVGGDGGSVPARLLHTATAAWRLRRWLARNPVDLIHCHESAPALVAWAATRGRNIPLAVTYHGSEPERIGAFGKIAARTDLVITPSHASARDLRDIGGVPEDKLRVIGLGVEPPKPVTDAEVAAKRAELLGEDGRQIVVTIARFTHQKGIDILIDVVARMKETHPHIRFALVGYGPLEDEMRALAREKGVTDHLIFTGRTETPALFLRAADLFLLTSRWEALPFTIVEAFQTGTPAVAAACSGVVELIDEAVGAVTPIGDVEAACAAVADVLGDEPRRQAMADAALARSREDRFSPDWIHEEFERTYRTLAGQTSS